MPKDTSIHTILVIGSGPIVIGQAAEFDYAGTQACIALKEEGFKVVLINNNPATIMTDEAHADVVYLEPLTVEAVTKIIEKERPNGLLATLGGQTGLNLAFELHEKGVLKQYNLRLLGTSIESIHKGEDRQAFRQLMMELNEPIPESKIVHQLSEAIEFANGIGYPIIIRPAYTLGGTGGGIADDIEELTAYVKSGLKESAIGQCLIEQSIAGFKEIEYEVMRDSQNTCITICNMENIDPVGIHTGDSIVVAPSQTLTDQEYQMLRNSAIKIITALGIVGGCNIQFALDPTSKKYYLIEVNPRVSRSSALASKATGYPIARIAAKLAVGYHLHELKNPVTNSTYASFEPALDYVVVKFPRLPFDKFPTINRTLGTQMKATGEVLALERNLHSAIQKAIHSLEIQAIGTVIPSLVEKTSEQLWNELTLKTDERFFIILELLRRNGSMDDIFNETKIDRYFLHIMNELIQLETQIAATSLESIGKESLYLYKQKGFSDEYLSFVWGVQEEQVREKRNQLKIKPSFKMVDTCAAEFTSVSNYFYSSYYGENEQTVTTKKKVAIIGSGPIRIGQGIEFDYSSVHGVYALKEIGIETIMINNNPETVSTDFATADRLYFEPLTLEYVLNVIEAENITDVIVQFGGQTAINLAKNLEGLGVNVLGSSSDVIDQLEDRERFYHLLDSLNIPHISGMMAQSYEEMINAVNKLNYPVLIRPSYVIGGKGMLIVENDEHMESLISNTREDQFPILIDSYVKAMEAEIDLIADGQNICVPLIVEHIEKSGVHSGDSIAVLPAQNIQATSKDKIISYAQSIVKKLNYKGLMNIQYIVKEDEVYILEVNPRASRSVPIVSKIAAVPMVNIATKILLGKYLLSNEQEKGLLIDKSKHFSVKYPVFSYYALKGLDNKVGPEMKSTGEGIGIGSSLEEALFKAYLPLKHKLRGNEVIVTSNILFPNKINKLLEEVGLIITLQQSEELNLSNTVAVLSVGESINEIKWRETAIKMRIPTFTELDSFEAFLLSMTCKHWDVKSINDWNTKEKGVTVS